MSEEFFRFGGKVSSLVYRYRFVQEISRFFVLLFLKVEFSEVQRGNRLFRVQLVGLPEGQFRFVKVEAPGQRDPGIRVQYRVIREFLQSFLAPYRYFGIFLRLFRNEEGNMVVFWQYVVFFEQEPEYLEGAGSVAKKDVIVNEPSFQFGFRRIAVEDRAVEIEVRGGEIGFEIVDYAKHIGHFHVFRLKGIVLFQIFRCFGIVSQFVVAVSDDLQDDLVVGSGLQDIVSDFFDGEVGFLFEELSDKERLQVQIVFRGTLGILNDFPYRLYPVVVRGAILYQTYAIAGIFRTFVNQSEIRLGTVGESEVANQFHFVFSAFIEHYGGDDFEFRRFVEVGQVEFDEYVRGLFEILEFQVRVGKAQGDFWIFLDLSEGLFVVFYRQSGIVSRAIVIALPDNGTKGYPPPCHVQFGKPMAVVDRSDILDYVFGTARFLSIRIHAGRICRFVYASGKQHRQKYAYGYDARNFAIFRVHAGSVVKNFIFAKKFAKK